MALKTQKNKKSVKQFIDSQKRDQVRKDCKQLMKIFKKETGKNPKMWGSSIVGYGEYHYKTRAGTEGDWPITGFSPRAQNLTVYIMPGFKDHAPLLKKLGKHKKSVSCLYFKKMDDIDEKVLAQLIRKSVRQMKKLYTCK